MQNNFDRKYTHSHLFGVFIRRYILSSYDFFSADIEVIWIISIICIITLKLVKRQMHATHIKFQSLCEHANGSHWN